MEKLLDSSYPKIIFILGPTASGKSALALKESLYFGAEIVNCDSVQMYESVQIGTAKPSIVEQNLVPHHLLNFIKEGQSGTAGDFRRDFFGAIEQIQKRKVEAVFAVGGSGFYIQAVEFGMYDVEKSDPEIRKWVQQQLDLQGLHFLYMHLTQLDPDYANKVGPNDSYRIQRGLEMVMFEKKTMAEIQKDFEALRESQKLKLPYRKIGIHLDREILRHRVRERLNKMLSDGLIDEVQTLRAKGLNHWWPMQSVGYIEVQNYLDGICSLDEMKELIVNHTMQLAKRQMTWFKRDKNIIWFESESEFAKAHDYILNFLRGE